MIRERRPPDIPSLLRILSTHDVAYVIAGSVAVQAWSVDVGIPGDLDIVPNVSRANLARLADALRTMDAIPWPVTGRWVHAGPSEFRWEPYPEEDPRYGVRLTDPDPDELATFDSLFETVHGEFDIVPLISGTFEELAHRSRRMTVHGVPDVRVMSIGDLLARLTVSRREKDQSRVQALRGIERRLEP